MTHGVKHLLWRNGRPRWHPSKTLRERGFKGKDLKDEAGHWLPLPEAKTEARELNKSAGVQEWPERHVDPSTAGYVYFLFTDTEKVKIGFTKTPGARLRGLASGMESLPEVIIVVPGSQRDERELHEMFFSERFKHEWFFASRRILNVALASARARRVDFSRMG